MQTRYNPFVKTAIEVGGAGNEDVELRSREEIEEVGEIDVGLAVILGMRIIVYQI